MLKRETENFIINYQEGLEQFVLDSLTIWKKRKSLIKDLFGEIIQEKIKASFFTDRESFVEYIQSISNGSTPPSWATGCFYNGEVQTLININKPKEYQAKEQTLLHEMVHLHFDTLIYQKHNLDRVRWFDESYALFLDGTAEKIPPKRLFEISNKLLPFQNLNLNELDDLKNVKSENYDGYDIFLIVGYYIFKNNLEKELILKLINNPQEIRIIGRKILKDALCFIRTEKLI